MSPKCLPPKARRQIIRDHILNLTYEELAVKCRCTKRTIIRDVNSWRREGGFEECLFDEFLHSYPHIKKVFPEKAFDRLCYLMGKHITRKMEVKEEYTEKVLHVMVSAKLMKDDPTTVNSRT